MLACTALAQRRRDRDDAEQFLSRANLSRVNPPGTALPRNPDRQLPMSI